jgi:hypothetical protein
MGEIREMGHPVAGEGQRLPLHGAGEFRIDGHLGERAESSDEIAEL